MIFENHYTQTIIKHLNNLSYLMMLYCEKPLSIYIYLCIFKQLEHLEQQYNIRIL